MKTSFYVSLAVLVIGSPSLRASSSAVNGAVVGGVAGAVIGHNSRGLHHNGWRGAARGAGTGLLVGAVMDRHRGYRGDTRVRVSAAPRTYLYRNSSRYYGGHFHGYGRYARGWGYPAYYYRPGYAYLSLDGYAYPSYSDYDNDYYARPNYAANGAILGALAGAVIGNNSGDLRHNGWAGAGLGAAAGYLVGSIAENNARRREAVLTEQAATVNSPASVQVASAPPANAPDQTVTVSKPKSSSAMSSANELFGR